jgi:hypothetical protein
MVRLGHVVRVVRWHAEGCRIKQWLIGAVSVLVVVVIMLLV